MLDILIIHHCDSWGGAGVSLRNSCQMLCKDFNVTVCVPHMNTVVTAELGKIPNLKIVSIETDIGMISAYNGGPSLLTRTFYRNIAKIFSCKEAILRIVSEGNYDLILLNSITISWISKLVHHYDIPVVTYIRETKVNHWGYSCLCHIINKYCAGLLFISEYDQKQMNSQVRRQQVIKNSVDLNQYNTEMSRNEACEQFLIDADSFNVLFLGGTSELKGYQIALDAFKELVNYPISLIVAGAHRPLDAQTQENVHYVGPVSQVEYILRACDVLIFPSTAGHQARPIFEAGAMSLPVIVSDFPETAEDITDGVNGYVFEPRNSLELAKKILILFNNKDLSMTLGKANRTNTEKEHDFDVQQQILLAYLHGIIEPQVL